MFRTVLVGLLTAAVAFSNNVGAKSESVQSYSGQRSDVGGQNLKINLTVNKPAKVGSALGSVSVHIESKNGENKDVLDFLPTFFKYSMLDLNAKMYQQLFESQQVLNNYRLYNGTRDSGEDYETVDVNAQTSGAVRTVSLYSLVDHNGTREETGVDVEKKLVVLKVVNGQFTFISVKKQLHYLDSGWKTKLDTQANLGR